MFTNEIKKGTRIQLRNGWKGTMADNRKGNIRMAEVEGIVTELGSVYAHDIVYAWPNDERQTIELTKAQIKLELAENKRLPWW